MADIARLVVEVDSRQVKNADKALKGLGSTGNSVEASLKKLSIISKAVITSVIVKQVVDYADAMKLVEGRLKLVTSSSGELAKVQRELFDISQKSRVSFTDTADLYSRIARSTQALGYSTNELLKVTETISKSMIISGASAESANAAIIQLGQGFASGTLRGEELNSVLEQAPRLAQAIAEGMGVTVGELRKLGAEGQITAEKVMSALISQSGSIQSEFGKMPQTVGQSMTMITNSLGGLIGEIDKGTGATAGLSNMMSGLSEIIDDATLSIKAMNDQIVRLQDTRKVKTTEAAQAAIKSIDAEIKALTTSQELGDMIMRGLKSETQIKYELNQLTAQRAELVRKTARLEVAEQEEIIKQEQKRLEVVNKSTAELELNYEAIKAIAEYNDQLQASMVAVNSEMVSATGSEYDIFLDGLNNKMVSLAENGASVAEMMDYFNEKMLGFEMRNDPTEGDRSSMINMLMPVEGLQERFEQQQDLISELFDAGMVNEQERKTMMEELEIQHQNRLYSIRTKGLSDVERFNALNWKGQFKTTAGFLTQMTSVAAGESKKMFEINKAAAIAQATMNAHESITGAYKFGANLGGPPLGAAMAGLAGAAQFATISKIASSSFGGGGGVSSMPNSSGGFTTTEGVAPSNIPTGAQREEALPREVTINLGDTPFVSTDVVRELVNSINEEIGDGVIIRT